MADRGAPDDELTPADLRRIRLQKHLSQSELARHCGVSRPYVAQVESGRLRPRPGFITLLSSLGADSEASSDPAERISELVARRPALTRTDVVKAFGRRSSTERRIDELLRAGRLEERLALGENRDSRLARRLFIAGTAPAISRPDPALGELRRDRELARMSQPELARRIGVTAAAIAKWEATGTVPPRRAEELVRILRAAPTASEIAAARNSAGWSRPELGRRIGVTGQMVRLWELGEPVSTKRRQALRLALEDARATAARPAANASEALLELVRTCEALTRTDLVGWRHRFQLNPGRAEVIIDEAAAASELHEERRLTGPRRWPVRYLVAGPAAAEPPSDLAREELRALREVAGLTPGELAERLGVSAGAVRGWESGPAKIPQARAPEIRRALAERSRERSLADEAAREILAVVARHPDIGRTELFERHVGERARSRTGLARALEDGLVHEVLVELPHRGPYWGLRAGRAEGDEGPALSAGELRRERQALRLTQRELAQAVGVTTSTVCGWETGKRIRARSAAALRDALSQAAARPWTGDVDRSLRAVTSAVERRPGEWSVPALLGRLRREGAEAALELALTEGIVHVEHRLIPDRRGRPIVRKRLYPGPGESSEEWPLAPEAQEIVEVRRAANVTQSELARRVGVTESAIALWEKGNSIPPGRRQNLRGALDTLSRSPAKARGRRLPRRDRPTVAQLVAEHPGSTRGQLCARVNRKRRLILATELAAAIASGHVQERRAGRRVELFLVQDRPEV